MAAQSSAPAAPRAVIASPFEVMVAAQRGQNFCRAYRLLKTDDFSSVFAFRRSLRGRFYTLYYRPNELDTARFGVTVAKKLVKRANGRNLLKRIAREVFRRQRECLPSCDLIVRLHASAETARRAELHTDIRQLLGRLPGTKPAPQSVSSPET
ncbi:MAG: ribonuclease P protein component [Azoarcus sp.]|nr:ribonuclease P protein component [Azoarcus sp.]